MNENQQAFLCGFVALAGRPNVGKSTLLNALIGQEISITANRPQTTRNRVRGIKTTKEYQMVIIDTPGIHQPHNELHSRIVDYAKEGVQGVDLVLFLTEPIKGFHEVHRDDLMVLEHLKEVKAPVVLVVNKMDSAKEEEVIETLQVYNEAFNFAACIPLAAIKKKNLGELEKIVKGYLPQGEPLFGEDELTDQPERQIMAEFVREQIHRRCFREVPYGVAVKVDKFFEEKGGLKIFATIFVERESHKMIVIGKKGTMIRDIGKYARIKMEYLMQSKVYLDLHVKVSKDWFNNPARLNELGYQKDKE